MLLQDQSLRGHESPKPMGKTPRHTIGPGVWNQELDGYGLYLCILLVLWHVRPLPRGMLPSP